MTLAEAATGFGGRGLTQTTLIGIDVGTTAIKAVLIDADGQLLARSRAPYAISRPAPGHAEQNPDDWMAGVLGALDRISPREHDLGGLAGHRHLLAGQHPCLRRSRPGTPLLPAIIWQDGAVARPMPPRSTRK